MKFNLIPRKSLNRFEIYEGFILSRTNLIISTKWRRQGEMGTPGRVARKWNLGEKEKKEGRKKEGEREKKEKRIGKKRKRK